MTRYSRPMGWGLRALNRIAGLPLLDDPSRRERFSRWLSEASRRGLLAAGRAEQGVKRLRRSSRPALAAPPQPFDLTPSDDQALLREAAQRFAAEALRPAAAEADEAGEFPQALAEMAAEFGFAALNVPESFGGAGAGSEPMTNALVAEALATGDLGLAVACLAPAGAAAAIARYGSQDQKAQYLPRFASERPPQAALAAAEPRVLVDPMRPGTRARRRGKSYVLEGEKTLVPLGARADWFLVTASVGDRPAMFIVERGARGMAVTPERAMGLHPAEPARLRLNGVRASAAERLPLDLRGFGDLIAASRLAWCSLAVGATQAVLDYVIDYSNERQAFGEPISHRQAVAFMIADIGIELEGMRLATWRAAARAAAGRPFQHEAALAHSLCRRYGVKAGSAGVQLLGGHGFVKDHPVERWYRDLRAVGVMEGGVML